MTAAHRPYHVDLTRTKHARWVIALCASVLIMQAVAETNDVRAAIRAALRPEVRAQLAALETAPKRGRQSMCPPDYTSLLCDWIAHATMSSVTNASSYLVSWKAVRKESELNLIGATNLAAQIKGLPPLVKLSFAYWKDLAPAIPGVDYPGVDPEDAGSTPARLRLALCAPRAERRFRIKAEIVNPGMDEYEFHWMKVGRYGYFTQHYAASTVIDYQIINIRSQQVSLKDPCVFLIFARRPSGFWGPPSIVEVTPNPYGVFTYQKGLVFSINYGTFKDIYCYGDKNRMLGFERYLPGMVRGEPYSTLGEHIVETYSDFCPRTTHKVTYAITDGKLTFTESEDPIEYENATPVDRSRKW